VRAEQLTWLIGEYREGERQSAETLSAYT
jgi:hypothetical protein